MKVPCGTACMRRKVDPSEADLPGLSGDQKAFDQAEIGSRESLFFLAYSNNRSTQIVVIKSPSVCLVDNGN